ncbi:hypothetical protein [Xenorhabdus griffiniae]|uniref:hypothetical protein n=1 Tax=Xenorhabdus griffiniae TaxID=351672 RepID=UPI00188271AE|nr:hypothetical protein [Xenorhabdus griffiniae]MBE8586358.1 hypothetical protein [Xenorhabdus griffiniae]
MGRRWRARQRARSVATASRAQPVQRGWGGGGKRGGRRPTCLQGCWPAQRKAAKDEGVLAERGHGVPVWRGFWQGSAQAVRAEGAALCGGTSAAPISGGARHNAD